ncbi:hypothetical protein BRX43_13965 [Sphingomonas sp. S-NIH.Pt15_0812]|nr:hypothetical protein BRX43_13965 [Sphingomonas sp. S-NIH.Pt15_0812]
MIIAKQPAAQRRRLHADHPCRLRCGVDADAKNRVTHDAAICSLCDRITASIHVSTPGGGRQKGGWTETSAHPRIGIPRGTIYRREAASTFPQEIQLGPKMVA